MKSIILPFIVLWHVLHAFGSTHVRYNLAGYDPNRPKSAIVMSDNTCSGYSWQIRNSNNQVVLNGTIGVNVQSGAGAFMPKAYNYVIDFSSLNIEGNYSLQISNVGTYPIIISCQPYKDFIPQVLRTIRVRRSGSASALDHAISHLGDSACVVFRRNGTNNGSWSKDVNNLKINMLGGHYDAGDYIKFTKTEAYLCYYMLRAYEAAPALFDGVKTYSSTAFNDLLDECSWSLMFLSKTMPTSSEFIIQTGGAADHNENPRLPENDALNNKRECYAALSKPQMGLTAAALALGSKIFLAKGFTTEATKYKNKAIEIYAAAKASTITNAWWQGGGEVYYADNTANDDMQLAAIELYNATGTASYLTDARNFAPNTSSAGWSSWGNVNLAAHSRLLPLQLSVKQYITSDLKTFNTNANKPNNLWKLPHESVWGSLYSQMSVAHGALQYKLVSDSSTYDHFGYNVVDYLFGKNPWGLCFIANKTITNSIKSSYATIYKLQASKFPYGEIAEGPAPAADHADNATYFSPAHNPNLWHKEFNTSDFTFFEQPGDYVCMETTIAGLADGLFFLTLANNNFCSTPLNIDNELTFPVEKKTINEITVLNKQLIINSLDNLDGLILIDITGRKFVLDHHKRSHDLYYLNSGIYQVALTKKFSTVIEKIFLE